MQSVREMERGRRERGKCQLPSRGSVKRLRQLIVDTGREVRS